MIMKLNYIIELLNMQNNINIQIIRTIKRANKY